MKTLLPALLSLLLVISLAPLARSLAPAGFQDDGVCLASESVFQNGTHKTEYRVGVLAIRGFEAAYNEFNATFSDYLTATAGKKFSQPIKFTMVPLNFISLFGDVQLAVDSEGAQGVDFFYVNPSAFR